jgi:anion-transporting  ArsA/GET3 family ATPase
MEVTPLDALARRSLVVVTGKGGVGKSTLAAAIGRLLAERGRRTLVLEVDPRENVHHLLGLPPSGGEVARAGERLYLQNLKPKAVLDELVAAQLRIGAVAERVLASPIYLQLVGSMPGLAELAILSHALRSTGEDARERFDLVVLDAPASGHSVSLLSAPGLVARAIAGGPLGRAASRLCDFVADVGRCGIVAVTQAEEMPVDEVLELAELLAERVGRRPELLLVNGLLPKLPLSPGETASPELALLRSRREVNERELARLDRQWSGPRVDLPLLAIDRGPDLVAALAARLAAAGSNEP